MLVRTSFGTARIASLINQSFLLDDHMLGKLLMLRSRIAFLGLVAELKHGERYYASVVSRQDNLPFRNQLIVLTAMLAAMNMFLLASTLKLPIRRFCAHLCGVVAVVLHRGEASLKSFNSGVWRRPLHVCRGG